MFAKSHILHLSIFLTLLTTVIGVVGVQAAPSQRQPAQSPETSEMLQFTSSGHVLAFQTSGIYVATGSHMLRESFAGTKGAVPQASRPPAKDGQAQPLGTVSYRDLWEGITLIYDSPPGVILRSTYQVATGGDPGRIALRYNVPVHLDEDGNLVFDFDSGTMTASAPVAWQDIDGKRLPVDVAFRLDSSQLTVHFSIDCYNPAFPLTIDPTLTWNTFMGSSSDDEGYSIAVDGSGNVYVTGDSNSTWGNPVNAHAGGKDVFAVKLNSSGETIWNTFMGSDDADYGYSIAVDGNGNVYVTGYSYGTWGSPVNAHEGYADAFAAKLNSSGETVWNTFMGSPYTDYGYAIAVDGSENVYVAGESWATWGSTPNPVNAYAGGRDVFAAKLQSNGGLDWNTFMGSQYTDYGYAIAVDGSGNVYVGGKSNDTWGSPVNDFEGGMYDAFAAKINNAGVLQWNTFMGSSSGDDGKAIAVDGSGNVYVAGQSCATWGSPVNAYTGGCDAFAAKLNSSGVRQWHTFMGSSSGDDGKAIAVNANGNVYVAGESYATWGNPRNAHTGGCDAFAAKLHGNGARHWNTFMGSSSEDYGLAIAVDASGNVYVAGESEATWGSPNNAYAGGSDAFAAMLLKGALTPGIPLLLLDSSNE